MTKDEAVELVRDYCTYLKDCGCTDTTMTDLADRWPQDGSERKAMRWLGFIQGALYHGGYFSLEDLKNHSKLKSFQSNDGEND